ncbi:MAG: hypothetical protein FWD90_14160 [Defluviitaleaceae bacterium]|nr:hypothetical protein [Defluviitaleaceae bacterium]
MKRTAPYASPDAPASITPKALVSLRESPNSHAVPLHPDMRISSHQNTTPVPPKQA